MYVHAWATFVDANVYLKMKYRQQLKEPLPHLQTIIWYEKKTILSSDSIREFNCPWLKSAFTHTSFPGYTCVLVFTNN